ncbi:MAG: MATE family efflux transporter, partial [Clostridia bacterium]|nr:MATE family efflux transporter [Clostridia bacterium]
MGVNNHAHKVSVQHKYRKGKIEQDFTNGPLFKQIILFSIPIMLTNVLQLVFNTADIAVLGAISKGGDNAVAAVGATSSLVTLCTILFVGVSIGMNIVVSKKLGAGDEESVKKLVGMSLPLSLAIGILLVVVGWTASRPLLILMNCDEDVLDYAVKYMQIYFSGMPLVMLYNFFSAILRAAGDSKRPLIYLIIGGILNIGFNVFFVLVLDMDVEGVAIATVIAQGVAAVLAIIRLSHSSGIVRFRFKYAKFYKKELLEVLRMGVPGGIQSSLFALTNVFIQSTINLFGEQAMAGSSYASQVENYVSTALQGVAHAIVSIVSQNHGARKYDRIRKAILYATGINTVAGIILGLGALFLLKIVVGFITDDAVVIDYAYRRFIGIGPFYFMCGVMNVLSFSIRGLGKSITAMIVAIFSAGVLRVVWLNVVYALTGDFTVIFTAYPVSWVITIGCYLAVLIPHIKNLERVARDESIIDETQCA